MLLILYEGALGNTAKQIERIVGFSGNKQRIRERYSQKLQSLQVNYFSNLLNMIYIKQNQFF